jgi:hypothetical protein
MNKKNITHKRMMFGMGHQERIFTYLPSWDIQNQDNFLALIAKLPPDTYLGKLNSVSALDTKFSSSVAIIMPPSLLISYSDSNLSRFRLVPASATELLSRKRQTTAQSSIFDVGYLRRHERTADSTSNLAAADLVGAAATMSTTSLLDNTSQT